MYNSYTCIAKIDYTIERLIRILTLFGPLLTLPPSLTVTPAAKSMDSICLIKLITIIYPSDMMTVGRKVM